MNSSKYLNKSISFFKDATSVIPSDYYYYDYYFSDIRNCHYDEVIGTIRSETDKKSRQTLKKALPCVTPSGLFKKRNKAGLIEFSGVVVLDLDKTDTVSDDELAEAAELSKQIPSTLAVHLSVSGNGYAIYVVVNEWQANTYNYARTYYEMILGIDFDKVTSDVSRLRYVSSDANIYVADEVEPLLIPEKPKAKLKRSRKLEANSKDKLWVLAKRVVSKGVDITPTYYDWLRVGMAIKSEYGENGRDLFHYISHNHPDYDSVLTDEKYTSLMRSNASKVGIGTLIYMLKQHDF